MSDTKNRLTFRFRAFVSLLAAFSFAAISITGIILYLAPSGRLAGLRQWSVWSLSREQWIALHLSFSVVFMITAILHLWLNRKPLLTYLKLQSKIAGGLRWELPIVLLLSGLIIWATLTPVEPITSLLKGRQHFYKETATGQNKEGTEIAGMGQLTLEAYCREIGLNTDRAIEALKQNGLIADKNQTLRAIADHNGTHPSQVRRVIDAVQP
jgi:hypothetical protein